MQRNNQPDNCIHIKPFEGEARDRELYALYPFLQKISGVKTVLENLTIIIMVFKG